jgi:hypothetical protein
VSVVWGQISGAGDYDLHLRGDLWRTYSFPAYLDSCHERAALDVIPAQRRGVWLPCVLTACWKKIETDWMSCVRQEKDVSWAMAKGMAFRRIVRLPSLTVVRWQILVPNGRRWQKVELGR